MRLSGSILRGRCPRNASSEFVAGKFCLGSLLVLLVISFAPPSLAQRAAAAHAAAPHSAPPHFNPATATLGRNASRFRHHAPRTSLPFPFFGDFFDVSDLYSSGYPVASEPPPMLMPNRGPGFADYQARPEMSQLGSQPSAQPLMIELQGDRYVRVNNAPIDGEALPLATAQPAHSPAANSQVAPSTHTRSQLAAPNSEATQTLAATAPRSLPPVTLIYHDGHSEQVRDYTIADGKLYARGDLYTDGYWSKTIDLATLNVAQTLEANAAHNINFALPSSPNEVITRF